MKISSSWVPEKKTVYFFGKVNEQVFPDIFYRISKIFENIVFISVSNRMEITSDANFSKLLKSLYFLKS